MYYLPRLNASPVPHNMLPDQLQPAGPVLHSGQPRLHGRVRTVTTRLGAAASTARTACAADPPRRAVALAPGGGGDRAAPAVAQEPAGLRRSAGRGHARPATTASATRWSPWPPSRAASAAVYFVNDVADAERDRRHPVKRRRAVASGRLPAAARAGAGRPGRRGAEGASLAIGSPALAGVIGAYLVSSVLYSLVLKHVPVVELLFVASGFVLRALGGAVATHVPPSAWFLVVCSLGALMVAIGQALHRARGARRGRGPAPPGHALVHRRAAAAAASGRSPSR